MRRLWIAVVLVLPVACGGVPAEEKDVTKPAPGGTARKVGGNRWAMFGGDVSRNLANEVEKGLPTEWNARKRRPRPAPEPAPDAAKTNVKWSAKVGGYAYGGPVIAGGRVFIGTNNDNPRDPMIKGDKGVLMCFRESDGEFLWQAVHDKLPNPDQNDTPKHGVASPPCVDGDRLYYVSNRCEIVCADVAGDEKTHKGKVLWTYDMIGELGVYPCYLAVCAPLVLGDLVFVVTANGVDPGNHTLPAPNAPSFVAVHKRTGKLVWKDASPGDKIMEGQWANPTAAEVKGKWQVIFPGGDGWLYSFEPTTGKLLWKFDCNPKKATYKPGGRGDRSYFVATPVVWENKLYIGTGDDPEDGAGVGHLWCIDITKEPKNADKDLSPRDEAFDAKAEVNKDSALVWHHGGEVKPRPEDGSREYIFGRTLSTVAIHDGLVYAAELPGFLQCLDARTGKKYWEYDMKSDTWSSPYYVDGKVYLGTDSGTMFIFTAGKDLQEPKQVEMDGNLKTPVLAVNGTLFITAAPYLFAIAK
jgi:outer membrane protein assembly factor BamB